MANWLKLYRSLMPDWASDTATLLVWLQILMHCNEKETVVGSRTIKAGEVLLGREKLAEMSGLTVYKVRCCLDTLVEAGEIEVTSSRKCSIIKVVNWKNYTLKPEKPKKDVLESITQIHMQLPEEIPEHIVAASNRDSHITIAPSPEVVQIKPPRRQRGSKDAYLSEFEELWKEYPRKEGKTIAQKKYLQLRATDEDLFQKVKNGIGRYKAKLLRDRTERQYIKQGSTFFNQQCWEDDFGGPSPNNTPNPFEGRMGIDL